eukprot:Em0004g1258a
MAEQSGEVMVRSSAAGHNMVTKRIKSNIRAEWAHGPTRSIQPQPPPNGHLTPGASPNQGKGLPIAKRKQEELPLTGVLLENGRDLNIATACCRWMLSKLPKPENGREAMKAAAA